MGWVVLYVVATLGSIFAAPHLFDGVLGNPISWFALLALLLSLAYLPVGLKAGALGRAFLASSTAIAASIALAAVSLFPRLVPSSTDLAYSLTAANASSISAE